MPLRLGHGLDLRRSPPGPGSRRRRSARRRCAARTAATSKPLVTATRRKPSGSRPAASAAARSRASRRRDRERISSGGERAARRSAASASLSGRARERPGRRPGRIGPWEPLFALAAQEGRDVEVGLAVGRAGRGRRRAPGSAAARCSVVVARPACSAAWRTATSRASGPRATGARRDRARSRPGSRGCARRARPRSRWPPPGGRRDGPAGGRGLRVASKPVAMTVTLTSSRIRSSMTVPKMMLASGSAASLITSAASLTSNRPRSLPPVTLNRMPRAPGDVDLQQRAHDRRAGRLHGPVVAGADADAHHATSRRRA